MKEFLIDWSVIGALIGFAGLLAGFHFGSKQRFVPMFISIFVMAVGMFGLMIGHTAATNEMAEACRTAGGHPIIGDRGHYKTCIAAEHIIGLN